MADSHDDFSDLTELGIDLNESDTLTLKFNKATKHIQSIASNLDNETLLEMYAYYKQAIEGPCNVPKPSWYDLKNKSKWESWNKLGDMTKDEAKHSYVENVKKIDSSFDVSEATVNQNESWVRVSCLTQEKIMDHSILDYIREENTFEVKKYLEEYPNTVNKVDKEGLGFIHYAADIGSIKIMKILLEYRVDVNLKDEPQGQTALHYAASCGHLECVKLLLEKGANKNIKDVDGETPCNVASDAEIEKLLK